MTNRYTVISVPDNTGGAFWFVWDVKTRKTLEAPSAEQADRMARELNAIADDPREQMTGGRR